MTLAVERTNRTKRIIRMTRYLHVRVKRLPSVGEARLAGSFR